MTDSKSITAVNYKTMEDEAAWRKDRRREEAKYRKVVMEEITAEKSPVQYGIDHINELVSCIAADAAQLLEEACYYSARIFRDPEFGQELYWHHLPLIYNHLDEIEQAIEALE